MRRSIVVAALAAVAVFSVVSAPSSPTRLMDSATNAGAGEYDFACALWGAYTNPSGPSVSLCGITYNAAGYSSYPTPSVSLPQSIVAWYNNCGTEVGCTSYYHQASMSPTDFVVSPLANSATLSVDVSGCQLSFDLQGNPANPTDGFNAGPSGTVWPSDPWIFAGAGAGRALITNGVGSVCDEPLGQGPVAVGFIVRQVGASASYQNFGAPLFPSVNTPWDIHGTVTNTAGQPIAGAHVSDGRVEALTGADGTYDLKDNMVNIATGIFAYADGYGSVVKTVTIVDQQYPVDFVLPPAN